MKRSIIVVLVALLTLVQFVMSGNAQVTPTEVRTFVLSNELGATGLQGGLIDQLIAAGHGNDSLYTVLQFLAADPGSGIPADFVAEVGTSPAGSEVFTVALSNFAGLNSPVCINADGTLKIAAIYGKDYDGDAGFVTTMVYYSGIALANFTITSDSNHFIDTGYATKNDPNQNYQAIGIAYTNHGRTFVISNELGTESEGGLIDQLIAAGHGDDSLYEVLVLLAANPSSGIPADFVAEVNGNDHNTSEVFTATLSMIRPAGGPFFINADGTISIQPSYGRDFDGQTGYTTETVHYSGIGLANFTMAQSPAYFIDAGSNGVTGQDATIYYKAIGIAWCNSMLTFVLSNEAPGYLIDLLITDGYGSSNLYDVLVHLQLLSGGVITDEFLNTLAGHPGSEVLTAPLSNYTGANNPVCINADGTVNILGIFGRDYDGHTGYETYPTSGVDRELFTHATSQQYYIDAGFNGSGGGYYYYKAFAIAWAGTATAIPTLNEWSLILLSLALAVVSLVYMKRRRGVED
ncbi:MAG: IPTL-CTERM sorting domain-containing protein [Pseudomonadota bacterium]